MGFCYRGGLLQPIANAFLLFGLRVKRSQNFVTPGESAVPTVLFRILADWWIFILAGGVQSLMQLFFEGTAYCKEEKDDPINLRQCRIYGKVSENTGRILVEETLATHRLAQP